MCYRQVRGCSLIPSTPPNGAVYVTIIKVN